MISPRIPASQNGAAAESKKCATYPLSTGPTIKPIPKAAPISPKFFARLAGVEISAIDACAMLKFAAASPPIKRLTKISVSDFVIIPRPKIT